jgi:hypothetical protein
VFPSNHPHWMTELQLLPESETITTGMTDILNKKDQKFWACHSEREKEFWISSCKITRLHWSAGTRICKPLTNVSFLFWKLEEKQRGTTPMHAYGNKNIAYNHFSRFPIAQTLKDHKRGDESPRMHSNFPWRKHCSIG